MIDFLKKLLPVANMDEDEPVPAVRSEAVAAWSIPDRYRIKKADDGSVLTCLESPNLVVRVQKGRVVSAPNARKSPERTIFLDGAAGGEPFMDHDRQIYNLDHHEGVERSFTLSTCEQSLVMVRKGLNLKDKNWTIYANEPDLDTVLAIWILLNHLHITPERSHVLGEIVPLIRLEGIIDALGLEHIDLLAFPPELLERTRRRLEKLREEELTLKKEGKWNDLDYTSYTYGMLKKIDNVIFRVQDFRDFKGVVEVARADITETDAAVVYHCDMGIYELEEYLTKLYGKKPTFIILQKDRRHYTIRKGDMFSPLKLDRIYERLNLFDPAVSGQDAENRWGGSGDIGGSPRGTGTGLSATRIVRLCREAFEEIDSVTRLKLLGRAAIYGVIPQLLGWMSMVAGLFFSPFERFLTEPMLGLSTGFFTFLVTLTVVAFYFSEIRRSPTSYGLRLPVGWDWLRFLPVSVLTGVIGGSWLTLQYNLNGGGLEWLFGALILPVMTALLYFGGIHGNLVPHFLIQRFRGPFFISSPAIFAAVAFACGSAFLPVSTVSLFDFLQPTTIPGIDSEHLDLIGKVLLLPVYFVYGLSLSVIRERTESILPVIGIHTTLTAMLFFFL
jgi:hypothetical protein